MTLDARLLKAWTKSRRPTGFGHWAVTAFPLTGANDAVAHAAAHAGPFKLTVLKP